MHYQTTEDTAAVHPIVETAFEGHDIRVLGTPEDPWFIANEVCEAAEISNPSKAVQDLDEDEKGITISDTLGGRQKVLIVNLPGLLNLLGKSRKDSAKRFWKWVRTEVLPAVLKHGYYLPGMETDNPTPEDIELIELNLRMESAKLRKEARLLDMQAERRRALPGGMTVRDWLDQQGLVVSGFMLPRYGYIMSCAAKRHRWPIGTRKAPDGTEVKAYKPEHIALTLAPRIAAA